MKKYLFSIFAVSMTALLLCISCKSTDVEEEINIESPEPADVLTVSKAEDSMFWTIKHCDEEGIESTVYLFGTYHLADERAFPLPDSVVEAWDSANRVVGELSSEDWSLFQDKLNEKINESIILGRGKSLIDELSKEELLTLINILGDDQMAILLCYEPWVINSVLSACIIDYCNLNFNYSYDSFFINLAADEGKTIEGLDDLQTQLDLNCYGDWDIQLDMLKETITSFDDLDAAKEEINTFYETYLSGNEKDFEKIYFEDLEETVKEKDYYQNYVDALLLKRNAAWVEKLNEYLSSGEKTFVFAGCGHFVGEDSVINLLLNK